MGTAPQHDEPNRRNIFMHLPAEICYDIFRYIAVSTCNQLLSPALWRPVAVDKHISRIGYFKKDEIIPLLLVCRKFHQEIAAVLYGENRFAFHVSGLSDEPIAFLEHLSPLYIQMLKKVIIRTGYIAAETDVGFPIPAASGSIAKSATQDAWFRQRELAVSIALLRQAWPARYHVKVDTENLEVCEIPYSAFGVLDRLNTTKHRGQTTVGYVWQMVIDRSTSGQRTFRRIDWLPYDFKFFSDTDIEDRDP